MASVPTSLPRHQGTRRRLNVNNSHNSSRSKKEWRWFRLRFRIPDFSVLHTPGRNSLNHLQIYANVKIVHLVSDAWKIKPGLVFCSMFKFKRAIQGEADLKFVIQLWHNIINYLLSLMLAFHAHSYSLLTFVESYHLTAENNVNLSK